MTKYRAQVTQVIEAVKIESEVSFQWCGAASADLRASVRAQMSSAQARAFLKHSLQYRLYADFYCPGFARATFGESSAASRPTSLAPFVRALSEANTGSGSSDGGWTSLSEDGEFRVLEKQGLKVWVHTSEMCVTGTERPGDRSTTLRMPKELLRLSPGFYMALGNRELPDREVSEQIRYYWNLEPVGAAVLMRSLSSHLNDAGIAFRLKVADSPDHYRRADAGVLYGHSRDRVVLDGVVREVHAEVAAFLKPRTPALTCEIAPGLAFAESPPDPRESYGTSRCELLAEGLLRAHEQDLQSPAQRLHAIDAVFRDAGLSLDVPYLNARALRQGPHP